MLSDPLLFALILGFGIIGGIYATVLGGGFFFYIPFFQLLLPTATFGSLIGTVRVGAVFRGIGSTLSTLRMISYRKVLPVIAFSFAGAALGAIIVADLSQRWILFAVIVGIIVSELAPRLATIISSRTFGVMSFFTGVYVAMMGAGTSVLLAALFRLKDPRDTDVAQAQIHARFAEFLLSITASAVYLFLGSLDWTIIVPWSIGALIGGVVGGYILKRMTRFSGSTQKFLLRLSFAIAFFVALWAFFR